MRIDSSGVVNIGTTAAADTDVKLQVAFTGGNSYIQIKSADSTGTSGIKFGRNSVANRAGIDWSASTDALQFRTGGTSERMRIDSSGRVLIAATSSYASSNADDLQVGDNTDSAQSGITLGSTVLSSLRFADAGSDSAGVISYLHSDDSMRFSAAGSERMRIDSSGRVGIGTSSPDAKLQLVPTAVDTNIFSIRRQDHATINLFRFFQDSNVSQEQVPLI